MKVNKLVGIYLIKNKVNCKVYVGSSINIELRWKVHISTLNNKRYGKTNKYFQNQWNKYGQENFEFSILEYCSIDQIADRENYWMEFYDSRNTLKGYNKRSAYGKTPPKKHSEESKRKMSESLKGRKIEFTDEWKRNISESAKKRGSNFAGKKHTEETRKKMSESAKKQVMTDETRKKISGTQKGRKISEETKKKMSETHKRRWQERKDKIECKN